MEICVKIKPHAPEILRVRNKTMKITFQKIFDAAWQAFIVEDKPPSVNGFDCKYLSKSGAKCAIGLVLPDGHPAQLESYPFDQLVRNYPELFDKEILDAENYVLFDLQRELHDRLSYGPDWSVSLDVRTYRYLTVARQFKLKVPNDIKEL